MCYKQNQKELHSWLKCIVKDYKHIFDVLKNDASCEMIIAGTTALGLHGLVLDKFPEDLDVLLYCPDNVDIEFFKVLTKLYPTGLEDKCSLDISNYKRRSRKLKINNNIVDFIKIQKHHILPNYLTLEVENIVFKIQPVEEVIDARRGYGKRNKDLISSLALKHYNFNL